MDLATFHALVRDEAKRGSSLDTAIPGAVRRAARWIERNKTLGYMRTVVAFTLGLGTTQTLSSMNLETTRLKSILNIRYTTEARYWLVSRQSFSVVTTLEAGFPTGFNWNEGEDFIRWNRTVVETAPAESLIAYYTEWPTNLTATPLLITYAEDLLLAKSMYYLAPAMRDAALGSMYNAQAMEALRTLILAEEEKQESGGTLYMGRTVA
ncbi:MAG: hypothetical protein HC883_00655 [Bdellovibrionaceae bacterium]|nr:hypothetical protein [Pseudobdellovibrionaceae bacterium]